MHSTASCPALSCHAVATLIATITIIVIITTASWFSSSMVVQDGQEVGLVLERTPFYAEQGGQAADTGLLASSSARFAVHDTRVGPWPALGLLSITLHSTESGKRELAINLMLIDAANLAKPGCCWRCQSCLQLETCSLPSAVMPGPVRRPRSMVLAVLTCKLV